KQKAAELAASGDAAGAAALMAQAGASDSGLKFATWSMLGFQTKFDTVESKDKAGVVTDDAGLDSAGIGIKSYWKASGNAVPNMPVYIEVAVAENDGFANLYQEGGFTDGKKAEKPALAFGDGFKNFLTDLIFDPFYWLGGQKSSTPDNAVGATGWTYLGHFVAGFENDWFAYKTGYKYAKLPPHTNVSWTTVDQDWEAGYSAVGGYAQFATNNGFAEWTKDLFGAKMNLVVAPNRTADRVGTQYGMYAYATAEFAGQYIDIQYNGAYGKTFDTIFDEIYETDIILGYQGKFGPVTLKVNGLYSGFGEVKTETGKLPYSPGSSDVAAPNAQADFLDGTASNIQLVYSDDYVDGTLAFRHRGSQANLMYVENGDGHNHVADQLGDLNTIKVWANVNYKMQYGNIGMEPYMITAFDKESAKQKFKDPSSIEFGAKLFGGYDFDVVKFDAYANMNLVTKVDDSFAIGDIGLKVSTPLVLNGLALVLGYDPADANADFITGIFELGLPAGINAQAGLGYRAAKNDSKAYEGKEVGFFLGANMKLNIPQKPIFYTQFVWNMDPYKGFGDGQDNINYDGYTIDSGVGNYAGAGAFRVALRWDI
ncbi:hypothetical protein IJ472_04920, partial [bacterium]|nr:hypothetical protein [bacterium]